MAKNNKKEVLNTPFAGLGQRLHKLAASAASAAERPADNAAPPLKAETSAPVSTDESGLFAQAMQGVEPVSRRRGRSHPPALAQPVVRFVPIDEELEVMAHLAELIAGETAINISWHKDYVRGTSQGVNQQLLSMLEAGRFSIQDYLDLHGLGPDEALAKVEEFLGKSRARGLRHVLVVHGKGKNSKGGESILKETLSQHLSHKRFARWVLAFCSARQADGGTGAMYILLKTWQGPSIFVRPSKGDWPDKQNP